MAEYTLTQEDMEHIIRCVFADGNGDYPSDDYVRETMGDIRRTIFIMENPPHLKTNS